MVAFDSYSYLLDYFGSEKVEGRYNFLSDVIESFISHEKIEEFAYISKLILEQAVLDYFADIHRLKKFHKIVTINGDKITAYTLYWILRRKPIQIRENAGETVKFANEQFILSYLQMYLYGKDFATLVPQERHYEHGHFLQTFLYANKYRSIDAQIFELVITAYKAGRAFQYSVDIARRESNPCFTEEKIELNNDKAVYIPL